MKKVFLLVIVVFGLTSVILWLAKTKYQVPSPKIPAEKSTERTKPKTSESITANQQQVINSNEATMNISKSERAEKIKRLMDMLDKNCGSSTSASMSYSFPEDVMDTLILLDAREIIPDLIERFKIKPLPKEFEYVPDLLVKLNAKESIPALVELLKYNDDKRWVDGALVRLGKFGNREIIIFEMINLLNNEDAEVQGRALTILERLNAKEAIPELIKLLNNKDNGVRRSVLFTLGKLGAKEVIPQFIELLNDNNEDIRYTAIWSLCDLNAKEVIPELVKLLKEDKKGNITYRAGNALVRLDAREVIPELIKMLNDENKALRSRARSVLAGLGEVIPNEVIPDLIPNLMKSRYDKDGKINKSTMLTLASLGVREIIPDIIALSKNQDDHYKRIFAAELYGELGSKNRDVIPALMELLKDEGVYVCEAAINSLKKLQARETIPEFVPALIEMLKSEHGIGFAIDCLSELGAKEAIPALIPLLTIDKPHCNYRSVHASASIALVELGAKELVPKENIPIIMDNVLYYSEDDSEFNRAINALKELGVIK